MKSRFYRTLFPLVDAALCMLSFLLAILLKFDGTIPSGYRTYFLYDLLLLWLPVLSVNLLLGGYSGIWIYASVFDALRQGAVTLISVCVLLLAYLLRWLPLSFGVICIYGVLFLLSSSLLRLLPRLVNSLLTSLRKSDRSLRRAMIVGAGAAGAMLVKRLRENTQDGLLPVACVDDDPQKKGLRVSGVPVLGSCSDISTVARRVKADEIVIAIPSMDRATLQPIYSACLKVGCPVSFFRSVVDAQDFLSKKRAVLQPLSIEDLLFRDAVKPDMQPVFQFLAGKNVLVTGGCGSIGSELCRQVLEHGCGHLIILDIHENGMFALNEELKERFHPGRYSLCVGSVRDKERLRTVFSQHRPDVVIHAAAHKHVPMMELNPGEAVKNNIGGTWNVLQCCAEYHVKRFVLISTDKAVNPTNVMGATKRVAELLVQSMNGLGGCDMAAVRFGNVLGSNGSVIPLFQKQIAAGGPVTVTHQEMRRYFMTIPEAVSLVLSAGVLARGGELFVLDMGELIRIYDLAESLIRLSGLELGKDIEIQITGLRPGEKMYEELSLDSESVDSTIYKKIFIVRAQPLDQDAFQPRLQDVLKLACENADGVLIRQKLLELVRCFSQSSEKAEAAPAPLNV